jgi:hypothetical protein
MRETQDGTVLFCGRNNDPFDWMDEQEPLVEDNVPDPEPTAFADIPAEMPGVVLESNVPAIETPVPPSKEERMAAAVENAGIDADFETFRFNGHEDRNENQEQVVITHNHINVVPAQPEEIALQEEDDDNYVNMALPLEERDDNIDKDS